MLLKINKSDDEEEMMSKIRESVGGGPFESRNINGESNLLK